MRKDKLLGWLDLDIEAEIFLYHGIVLGG